MEEKIKEWLYKQGFPLEMEVAKTFTESGFRVSQSQYYKDIDSEKYREIDIIASKGHFDSDGLRFSHITFIVECKKTKHPWIVFSTKNKIYDFEYIDRYITTEPGWAYLLDRATDEKSDKILDKTQPNYHQPVNIGHGVTQALSSGEDSSYKALSSVLKASHYYWNHKSNKLGKKSCQILFPLIVLDGLLFEALLNENGDIDLFQSNHSILRHSNSQWFKKDVVITIITKNILNDFIMKAGLSTDLLLNDIKDNLETILLNYDKIKSGELPSQSADE